MNAKHKNRKKYLNINYKNRRREEWNDNRWKEKSECLAEARFKITAKESFSIILFYGSIVTQIAMEINAQVKTCIIAFTHHLIICL